jgi:hypothetical protein
VESNFLSGKAVTKILIKIKYITQNLLVSFLHEQNMPRTYSSVEFILKPPRGANRSYWHMTGILCENVTTAQLDGKIKSYM